MEDVTKLPLYKLKIELASANDPLVVQLRGDKHIGCRGVDVEIGNQILLKEQSRYKDRLLVFDSGDEVENNLQNSPGHGFDLVIKDPDVQIQMATESHKLLNQDLYGKRFDELKFSRSSYKDCRHFGVVGNHEYRSRKNAGVWINQQIYEPGKTLFVGIRALFKVEIFNKQSKLRKEYRIYLSHRPGQSDAASEIGIFRACQRQKSDVMADLYLFGHFHKRRIIPDAVYDSNGKFKKVLYVVNPSPLVNMEYSEWAGYAPLRSGWFVNVFLPLIGDPYGEV